MAPRILIVLRSVETLVHSLKSSSILIASTPPILRSVPSPRNTKPCCGPRPTGDFRDLLGLDGQRVLFDWHCKDFKLRRIMLEM